MGRTTKKNCEHCGNEFEAIRSHAKFCSTTCKNAKHYSAVKDNQQLSGPSSLPKLPMEKFLEPDSVNSGFGSQIFQYLLREAQEKSSKLEKELNETKLTNRELENTVKTLEREKLILEKDHALELVKLENDKPATGLAGLAQDPQVVQGLMPALNQLMLMAGSKLMGAPPVPMPSLGEAVVHSQEYSSDKDINDHIQSFGIWFAKIEDANLRKKIFDLIFLISNIDNKLQVVEKMIQLITKNQVKYEQQTRNDAA